MSTADLDLFGPPEADSTYPRFTTVLRGYDPEQVHDFILRLVERTESLENELEEAKAERDAARRRHQMARDDAYNQLGARMADFIRLADQQSERIRKEAEDEARQRVTEARDLADQIRREAEDEAERARLRSAEMLEEARAERDRLLGGLVQSRDLALVELTAARDHLSGIVLQLETAMDIARSAHIGDALPLEDGEGVEEMPQVVEDLLAEDLLEREEGFEIVLPQFPSMEDGEEAPI